MWCCCCCRSVDLTLVVFCMSWPLVFCACFDDVVMAEIVWAITDIQCIVVRLVFALCVYIQLDGFLWCDIFFV